MHRGYWCRREDCPSIPELTQSPLQHRHQSRSCPFTLQCWPEVYEQLSGTVSWRLYLSTLTLSFAFCCCNKDHNQKQLGEERVGLAYQNTSLREGSQGRNSSRTRTWRQKPWRNAVYRLSQVAFTSELPAQERGHLHRKSPTTCNGLSPPTSVINLKKAK